MIGMSDTPTTAYVQHCYGLAFVDDTSSVGARRTVEAHRAEFDRWLAAHDREVAARAVRQAAEDRFYDGDRDRTLHGYYVLHDYSDRIERGEDV